MPQKKETVNTRVTRLEESMIAMAEAQIRMNNALTYLAEMRAQDQTEAREREKRIDERIEKLVTAIGQLIQKNGRA